MKNLLIILSLATIVIFSSCTATKDISSTTTIPPKPEPTTVEFSEGKTMDELLVQAQTAKKVIFIDFYTMGCLPCKMMDETVFTEEVVFDYYNDNFINVKMDGLDFDYYELAKQYNVQEYPTLVFVDEAGNILHSHTGATSAAKLLEMGKQVLNQRMM